MCGGKGKKRNWGRKRNMGDGLGETAQSEEERRAPGEKGESGPNWERRE